MGRTGLFRLGSLQTPDSIMIACTIAMMVYRSKAWMRYGVAPAEEAKRLPQVEIGKIRWI